MTEPDVVELVAEFYNDRARTDPTNAPSRRAIAAEFGVSASTAQRYLDLAEAGGRLCWPVRRYGRGKGITAEDVLAELTPGCYVSGRVIADRLGITRQGVNKHIQVLRRRGYRIVAAGRLGTMLVGLADGVVS